ncbi:MAG: RNA-binding transcriptional accessory protein [Thermoguttaceae bacterium]|nr:RNA-binding transcriptional accessory protein [Thermoguttaceae bacterium]
MSEASEIVFELDREAAAIAAALGLPWAKVKAAAELLGEGNTIPFVARYRKERTGGLDEAALRAIEDAIETLRELIDRKNTVLKTIAEQGKLDAALRARILACPDKKELEELYLPYKPKRRTRAAMARQRGLEGLAEILRRQVNPGGSRDEVLQPFIDPDREVPDAEAALRGAGDILAEEWADDSALRGMARQAIEGGTFVARVHRDWAGKPSKFEMYYDYREPLAKVPSHRFLAMRRGEAEGVLRLAVEIDDEPLIGRLNGRLVTNPSFLFHQEVIATVADCCRRLLRPSVEAAVLAEKKETADHEAIQVFAQNLRELLLAAPAGPRVVLGIDPGFRTGCKLAVIDATGKFLDHATIYPTPPHNKTEEAGRILLDLLNRHRVELIAVGNGTASRETDAFLDSVLRSGDAKAAKVTVSESGASIYSASEVARAEFPDLDVTVRGAISIARRLQDPLSELVKIDPKSIGVGQYQHDVNQARLRKMLDREVESCVNLVGVDLNTASTQLLSYVSGIGPKMAESIRRYRDAHGAFASRAGLLSVPRLGNNVFQQAAGFLRVRGGQQPLDNSAVHPESYYIVEQMACAASVTPQSLVGNTAAIRSLDPRQFVDERVGLPTIADIIAELEKPGRDPRQEFRVPQFADGVHEITDLRDGMVLEGVVTNVTRFGAFVDIGVHQDGLIHISELDQRFVKDPSEVVAVGDIVRVKVLEVDHQRRRIALSRKQA